MYTETITHYEDEDFESAKENMDIDQAIEILSGLPRGWFPYNRPSWSKNVRECDYENYKTCCAIDMAIWALDLVKKYKL